MLEKELLRKYLAGQCTEEEKLFVNRYLADHTEEIPALDALLESSWEKSRHALVPEEETMKHLQKLRSQLYPETAKAVSLRSRTFRYLGYAAAAVAAILIPLFLMRAPKTDPLASYNPWDSVSNPGSTSIHIVLPDSSTAWVSPNSTLHWNMHGGNRRMVRLEGEAFFDVTHRPAAPFIVQTGNINTRVLGTAFNIEAYQKEASLRISLVRGKVAVEKQLAGQDAGAVQSIETLQPGDILNYHKADSTARKEPLIITDIRQWTAGYLVLNDVLLSDALERISARYHITITCTNKAAYNHKRLSTVFKDETTEQMLDIIGFITGCKYRKKGKDQIEIF